MNEAFYTLSDISNTAPPPLFDKTYSQDKPMTLVLTKLGKSLNKEKSFKPVAVKKAPILRELGPINAFNLKQSMIKAVIPQVAKVVADLVSEITSLHNKQFKGSTLVKELEDSLDYEIKVNSNLLRTLLPRVLTFEGQDVSELLRTPEILESDSLEESKASTHGSSTLFSCSGDDEFEPVKKPMKPNKQLKLVEAIES